VAKSASPGVTLRGVAVALAALVALAPFSQSRAGQTFSMHDWGFRLSLPDGWRVATPPEVDSAVSVLEGLGVWWDIRQFDSLQGVMLVTGSSDSAWRYPYMTVVRSSGSGDAAADYEEIAALLHVQGSRPQFTAVVPTELFRFIGVERYPMRQTLLVLLETRPERMSQGAAVPPVTVAIAFKMLGYSTAILGFYTDSLARDRCCLDSILHGLESSPSSGPLGIKALRTRAFWRRLRDGLAWELRSGNWRIRVGAAWERLLVRFGVVLVAYLHIYAAAAVYYLWTCLRRKQTRSHERR